MDTGEFQGKVLAQLEAQGREIGELKTDVKQLETDFTNFRLELGKRNGNGMKRKLGVAGLVVAAAGGAGYFLASLVRGLLSAPK